MLSFLLRSVFLGLATAAVVLLAVPSLRNNVIPAALDPQPVNIASVELTFNQAVRRAAPAVVNIYSRKYVENDRSKLSTQGLGGSGVIVSEKGYIITNYHVVAQADQIVVALQDGRAAAAQLVGTDKRTDIAVLRVEGSNLPVIPLNSNYKPQVGDVVLASVTHTTLDKPQRSALFLPQVVHLLAMVVKHSFKPMPPSMKVTLVEP